MKQTKVAAILEAWLDYVRLDERASATVNVDRILEGGNLDGNRLLVDGEHFERIKGALSSSRPDDAIVALAFPSIFRVDGAIKYAVPLFMLDVTSCFAGQHVAIGWDLIPIPLDLVV